MGRGGGTLQTQLNKSNTAADVTGGQAEETFGTVNAADKAIIANPISEQEKQSTLQPLAESFDASSQAAGNLAAKTRNTSGYQANLDKMAQQRGSETAKANADLLNTGFQRKMQALGQQQGMFGTATGAQTGNLGTGAKTAADLQAQQNQSGFWGTLGKMAGLAKTGAETAALVM